MPGINDVREIVFLTKSMMNTNYKGHEMVYVNFEPLLPSYSPAGHPHLLGLKCLYPRSPVKEMTAADMIVTILFTYKPHALEAFLDLERPNFHLLCRRSGVIEFCISRRNRVVKVI